MRGSVEINGIFGLKCINYGPKWDILDYWGTIIFWFYYPFISYQRIKVYRVKKMDMGRFHWNNGVSGKLNPIK